MYNFKFFAPNPAVFLPEPSPFLTMQSGRSYIFEKAGRVELVRMWRFSPMQDVDNEAFGAEWDDT